jgi:outer membrane biosynthesis protein TonB
MTFNDDQYEQRGFFQRYGFPLGIGAVGLVVIGLVAGQMMTSKKEAPRRQQEVIMIRPLPTPPPPPQQKPPEPPKEMDRMEKQDTVTPDDEKPDESPQPAGPSITTSIVGNGPDAFGVGAARRGGDQLTEGGSRGQRSRFGWYAAEVQNTIQSALSRNGLISRAKFEIQVRIWADITGRITRAKLMNSTDDKAIDEAINESLQGLQLQQPPPADMKMPIVMKFSARRPN